MTQENPSKPRRKAPEELTPLDLTLLQRIADGDDIADIAHDLGENIWRVRYRLTQIKLFLPSRTLPNLIAEAVRKGVID